MSLSVIMPHYNHGIYVAEALDAILAQSHPANEIIIVDDASTDSSMMILEEYQRLHPQIKIFHNEKNLGAVATINRGVTLSTGEYLAFCAADDRVLPGFFEKTITFLQRHPEVILCTSNSRYFTDKSQIDDYFEQLGDQERVIHPDQLVTFLAKTPFYIPSQATVYRREGIGDPFLDFTLGASSDLYSNYKIALMNPIGFIPELLASFRISDLSYSANTRKRQRYKMFEGILAKMRLENEPLRSRMRSSAILSFFGVRMVWFLMCKPLGWPYLLPVLKKKFRNRAKKYLGLGKREAICSQ